VLGRAVLDADVVVAAVRSDRGASRRLLVAALERRYPVLASVPLPRFRLARPAQIDLANLLSISARRWGVEGRLRYAAVLADAMRQIADAPEGPLTKEPARTPFRYPKLPCPTCAAFCCHDEGQETGSHSLLSRRPGRSDRDRPRAARKDRPKPSPRRTANQRRHLKRLCRSGRTAASRHSRHSNRSCRHERTLRFTGSET
jgi:hypothetical protein